MASDPAGRHREVGGTFLDRARGTRDWDVSAPVDGWTARDVVRHLVAWFPGFLASGAGLTLPAGPNVDDDPVGAWQTQYDAVQALLDEPDTSSRVLANPHTGNVPLDVAIERFYTADVFMHTWDLSVATGQDDRLDKTFSHELLSGMEPMEEWIRSSGQYGERAPVPPDADVQTRLLGFIGRNPEWSPPP